MTSKYCNVSLAHSPVDGLVLLLLWLIGLVKEGTCYSNLLTCAMYVYYTTNMSILLCVHVPSITLISHVHTVLQHTYAYVYVPLYVCAIFS